MKKSTRKVLLWDIETSFMQVATFQLKTYYVPPECIIKDWYIISGCYKWLNEDKVYKFLNFNGENDKKIVEHLSDIISKADIIVHYNGDKFDIKKLKARMLKHRILPKFGNLRTVDLYKEAKKHFGLSSYGLDYLSKFLGFGGKAPHNREMWLKELQGNKQAIKDIGKYNVPDVTLMEQDYKAMLPWIDHPNINNGIETACPNCGNIRTQKRGYTATKTGIMKQKMQCNTGCGKYFLIPIRN